jgi:hypothetical protein
MEKQIAAMVLTVMLGLTGSAWASQFSDDFESYAAGAGLHGQGGWKGWNNSAGADAVISNLYASSGRQSVEIARDSDLVHEFSLSGGKWVVTAMQYVPTGSYGVSYFILLATYNDGGPNTWSVQTEYDLEAGTILPWNDLGSGARIVYDRWVPIKVVIDLAANAYEEYYNGVQIASGVWDVSESGTLEAVDLFANAASPVYYDDVKIDAAAVNTVSCFPRPAYDSGWITTPFGDPSRFYGVTLNHNLGGNADDYVVDLQRKVSGIAGPNLSSQGFASEFNYSFLTDRTVTLAAPYSAVDLVSSIRIRIWTYCDADSGDSEPRTK